MGRRIKIQLNFDGNFFFLYILREYAMCSDNFIVVFVVVVVNMVDWGGGDESGETLVVYFFVDDWLKRFNSIFIELIT